MLKKLQLSTKNIDREKIYVHIFLEEFFHLNRFVERQTDETK